jgi:hypothetical protein
MKLGPMLARLGGAIRDGWLMLGLTLVLFLALEFGYRGMQVLKGGGADSTSSAADSTLHPYAGAAWWGPFQGRDGLLVRKNRYDPYRGFWPIPATSRYVNVDSAGRRVTPQPSAAGQSHRQLFMLGGSTMWGFSARDSFTIPALTAVALRERGITDVEVVNLAQQAFNSTQEATTLIVELARGHVPAAAVFLDGYNDIATGVKYGTPGHTYGEEDTQQRIELGARGFWAELFGLGRHAELIQRMQRVVGITPLPTPVRGGPERVCGPVAGYFRNVAVSVEALGQQWDFPTLYLQQPIHATTHKRLTPWEKTLYQGRSLAPCAASIDSAMADRTGRSYFSLAGLFDADTVSVYVDEHAHITEDANREVAERIADLVAPLLQRTATRPATR